MALEASTFRSQVQAANLSAPTERFSNAKKAGEEPKAVYVAVIANGVAGTIHCAAFDEDVNFVTGGSYFPVVTDEAVAGFAACTVVYFY